jgi:hypothetical protein
MPSRARAEEAYDPAGPPPMTNTVHFSGIVAMMFDFFAANNEDELEFCDAEEVEFRESMLLWLQYVCQDLLLRLGVLSLLCMQFSRGVAKILD